MLKRKKQEKLEVNPTNFLVSEKSSKFLDGKVKQIPVGKVKQILRKFSRAGKIKQISQKLSKFLVQERFGVGKH